MSTGEDGKTWNKPDGVSGDPLLHTPRPETTSRENRLKSEDKACLILDWHGHVWEANDRACQFIGGTPEELADGALLAKVPAGQQKELLSRLRKALEGNRVEPWVGDLATSRGNVKVEWVFAPVGDGARDFGWAECVLRHVGQDGTGALKEKKSGRVQAESPSATGARNLRWTEAELLQEMEEQKLRIEALERELAQQRQAGDRVVQRMQELEKQVEGRIRDLRRANADLCAVGLYAANMLQRPLHLVERLIRAAAGERCVSGGADGSPPFSRRRS